MASPIVPSSPTRSPALLPGQPVFASRLGYSPFGVPASGATPRPFGFTGEMQDAATGLVYLRARWYDPAAGVFLSRDPFAGFPTMPYSQHFYQYAYSAPTMWTDPSGEFSCTTQPEQCAIDGYDSEMETDPEKALDDFQTFLDGVGTVPVIGEPVDLTNAGISAARGKWTEAGLSCAAMIPFAGWGATGAKYAVRYGDEVEAVADEVSGAIVLATKRNRGPLEFGHNIIGIRRPGSTRTIFFDQQMNVTEAIGPVDVIRGGQDSVFTRRAFPPNPARYDVLTLEVSGQQAENAWTKAREMEHLYVTTRQPYNAVSNSCVSTCKDVLRAADLNPPPWVLLPRQLHDWFRSKGGS